MGVEGARRGVRGWALWWLPLLSCFSNAGCVCVGLARTPSTRQSLTLTELESRSAAAKVEITTRYDDFSRYRDEAIELLKAADVRVQAVGAVRNLPSPYRTRPFVFGT
jgi:hypothetical protein